MNEKKEEVLKTAGKATSAASQFLKNYIIDIALVTAVLIYVLRSVIVIGETGKTVVEILADGSMTLLFGFIISRTLAAKGVYNGEKSAAFLATMEEYGKVIDSVTPYIDDLERFCQKKNAEDLKQLRTEILAREGIKYETYLREDFDASALSEEQQRAVRLANRAKLKNPLSTRFLTSENERRHGTKIGRSKQAYAKSSSGLDLLSKIGLCIVLSYFGVFPTESFSWYLLVWYIIQVGVFFLLGSLKYVSGYNFIVDEFRNRILYKVNTLYEFKNRHEKGELFVQEAESAPQKMIEKEKENHDLPRPESL